MRRLLKFVTTFFVVVTILMPLLEYFDRWDRPGLSNDTELPVFLIALFISLALLAMVAMARRFHEDLGQVRSSEIRYDTLWCVHSPVQQIIFVPFIIPPLRI
jgi:hypothetical protein